MRLVTFLDKSARPRVGALTSDGRIADLNAAAKLYLRERENDAAYCRMADARVPPDMRLLFEGGDRSLDAARAALDFLTAQKPDAGVDGEPVFFRREDIRLKAPISPKKFFHTAGNFREHHHEAEKAGILPSGAALDRFLPERRCHHWPRRAGDLSAASHPGARLRAGAGNRGQESRQALRRESSERIMLAAS